MSPSSDSQSTVARLFDAMTSKKGSMLAIPAILLFGAALAVGKAPFQATDPAAAPAVAAAAAPAPGAAAPAAAAVAAAPATTARALSAGQRTEVEAIIRDYLLKNPELMAEVQQAYEAKAEKLQAEKTASALKANATELFRSTTAPVAGNAQGDVTVVEFFDYNCGYCKKAFIDLATAADKDKKLKLVLKEFPILSKGSEETARVALAAKAQGKYWEFHRAMLETPGQANEASALKVAEKVGLNVAKLKTDMGSAEVKAELDSTRALAQKMGINGTPFFLVGDKIIPGAPDGLADLLVQSAKEIRAAGGCKIC